MRAEVVGKPTAWVSVRTHHCHAERCRAMLVNTVVAQVDLLNRLVELHRLAQPDMADHC